MIIACSGCNARYDVSGRKAGTRARCRCGTTLRIPKASTAAATLSCPACGAPCSPDDSRCAYCQAVLAVVACPSCYGRVFATSVHCAHCGAEVGLPAGDLESPSGRTCPRCREKSNGLESHLVGQTVLDECGLCGGVWVDAAAFDHLIKNRDEQAALISTGGPYLSLDHYATSSLDVQSPRYLPCPDCAQLMNRKNFAETSRVIVDVCKAHGIWFDRDELGRIVKFVMDGGLDTARRRELERLEQKLKEKRQSLSGLGSLSESLGPAGRVPADESWLSDFLLEVLRRFLG